MDLTIPYAKTDLAWSAIRTRSIELNGAARAVLIMIDGKRPLADLLPAIQALSLTLDDVRDLMARGLVAPCPRKQPVAVAARAHPPAQAPVSAPTPAPEPQVARPAPAPAPTATRSLAAAKFYALEQIARLLGRHDEELRLAARHVVDHPSLLAWLDACRHAIAEIAGEERASMLVARTHALIPELQPS